MAIGYDIMNINVEIAVTKPIGSHPPVLSLDHIQPIEMNVVITPLQHREMRLHIKEYFAKTIQKATAPLDVDDYNYQLKQVDLAPHFYDAMNDGKTGSAKITNIIMKDVSKGTEEIFQKWSMERRIHATDIRIQALYQALRPEEGQTSEEIIIQEKKLKSLELHSIKYSERRWIVKRHLVQRGT